MNNTKLFLISFALIFSLARPAAAVGTPEFVLDADSNSRGTLKVGDVFFNGIKTYENTEIHLDLETSIFTITRIQAADNSIPARPIAEITEEGLTIGLRGCNSDNRVVTCYLTVTSNEFDRNITFWENSTANNNLNNSYGSSKITLADESGGRIRITKTLVADIETEATIEFTNLSTRATQFSLMGLSFRGNNDFIAEFRNVDF